jgi:two-component system LytT family response regulator
LGISIMIADDDIGMRLVIRKAIDKCGGFKIVGEAEDGNAALLLFEKQRPDVVFLDVEMPYVTGVECAKKIADINPETVIIFATAHEEYMPEAFEVYAFNYLVKPFKMERLYQTLERIKSARLACDEGTADIPEAAENAGIQRSPGIMERTGAREKVKPLGKLMIRNRDGINLVDMEDIILIQREDRSTVIYTSQDRFTTSEGLSELDEKLDRSLFFRCHKSYIINLGSVIKIYPYGRWTYIVKLKGIQKDALLTHEKYEELERLFT